MPTPLLFSTIWPERMGDKAGKRNYFPEKVMKSLDDKYRWFELLDYATESISKGYYFDGEIYRNCHPKTQTIRENYEYWKKKEGKYVQPAIWSGKPYRSKMIYFCPPVLLKEVVEVDIKSFPYEEIEVDGFMFPMLNETEKFAKSDGFDRVDDFFSWFDKDFQGGLLKFGA